MTANAIEDRLIGFAVRIIKLADALPKTPAGKHITRQLLRSGTSPPPPYAAARGAKSNSDVEEVAFNPVDRDVSQSSGLPIVFGFTPDGGYIMVVYEQIDDVTIYPVTAYDVEE